MFSSSRLALFFVCAFPFFPFFSILPSISRAISHSKSDCAMEYICCCNQQQFVCTLLYSSTFSFSLASIPRRPPSTPCAMRHHTFGTDNWTRFHHSAIPIAARDTCHIYRGEGEGESLLFDAKLPAIFCVRLSILSRWRKEG